MTQRILLAHGERSVTIYCTKVRPSLPPWLASEFSWKIHSVSVSKNNKFPDDSPSSSEAVAGRCEQSQRKFEISDGYLGASVARAQVV